METMIQTVSALGVLFSGFGLVLVGIELGRFRSQLQTTGLRLIQERDRDGCCGRRGTATDSLCGYAIYVWRNDRWELEADLSAPGYEPTMPSISGAYDGQAIRRQSAPARQEPLADALHS